MKTKFVILTLLTVLALGCDNDKGIVIDLNKRDSISIAEFIDHIDVIQLETTSQSLLNSISQAIFYNECYYVFDSRQQAVLSFHKTGEFRYKIHSVGRGPGEYSYLGHFNIDIYNNRLMLLEPFGSILYYDLDGKFIEKVTLPSDCKAYNEVYAINKDTLLFVSLNEFYFVYYSSADNRIIKRIFPIDQDGSSMSPTGRMYQYKDTIYLNTVLSKNEIYNMSSDSVSVDYVWDFGKSNYKNEEIKSLYNDIAELRANYKQVRINDFVGNGKQLSHFISISVETNRYRIAEVMVENDFILVFYDKKEKYYYVLNKTIEGIQPLFRDITNESIVLWDYGSYEYKYYDMSVLNEGQIEIINNHNKETDNPFLVVYHLKQ
jgi:hypothetical protein